MVFRNMDPTIISVISIQDINRKEVREDANTEASEFFRKGSVKTIGLSVFKVMSMALLSCVPWNLIPRTNSIVYQSYWMEILFPLFTANCGLGALQHSLNLAIWFKEDVLMSIKNFGRLYFLSVIPYTICYISAYSIWSVYLQYNHPLPNLALILQYIGASIPFTIGLWFVLPSSLLAEKDFRQKLRIYMFYQLWIATTIIQNQVLMYFWRKLPVGFQFPIAFLIAGFRDLDMRVQSKLVTKMVGNQDESATALLSISVNARWAFFISIRLVGAELGTIFCAVTIEIMLHAFKTYKIIKELTRVKSEETECKKFEGNINITKLILTELVEGFAPIIYGLCIAIAYYGPNSHILSDVGNTYWSEKIEDIEYVFLIMFGLFAFDAFGALMNSYCLWKMTNINMLKEFGRVLQKYWFFMAIKLAINMVFFLSANDINFGMDRTKSFQWISNEGWMKLVNSSEDLTNKEKAEIFADNNLL